VKKGLTENAVEKAVGLGFQRVPPKDERHRDRVRVATEVRLRRQLLQAFGIAAAQHT